MIDFIVICACFVAATFLHKKITESSTFIGYVFYGWLSLYPTLILHYIMLFLWSLVIVKVVLYPVEKGQKRIPFLPSSVFIIKYMSISFILGTLIISYVVVRNKTWVEKQFDHTAKLFNFEWNVEPMLDEDEEFPLPHKTTLEHLHFFEISVITMMSLYYAFSRMQMFF